MGRRASDSVRNTIRLTPSAIRTEICFRSRFHLHESKRPVPRNQVDVANLVLSHHDRSNSARISEGASPSGEAHKIEHHDTRQRNPALISHGYMDN